MFMLPRTKDRRGSSARELACALFPVQILPNVQDLPERTQRSAV